MPTPLRSLLGEYRASARTEREKGTYFERLAVAFIKNDPGMAQEYEDAWLYSDWAEANGIDRNDDGIDVVARIRSDGSCCAIQCKFYREGHRIRKEDIDSFFTASGRRHFSRRLIIDTTDVPWSDNAEAALVDQDKPISRLGLDRLEESPIDWSAFLLRNEIKLAAPKTVRPHQEQALVEVRAGLAEADRGKLILACGTGKTFTGLKIAEDLVGPGGLVLFLVPSLALMSQSIREWTIDAIVPLRAFAVCSDAQVGKRRKHVTTDVAEIETHDLDYPATTDAGKLAQEVARPSADRMTVVFATYQSIQAISNSQHGHGLPEFDLIICDEAHRTTGAKEDGEDESYFVRVHDQSYIAGRKRLYMTATPKVFAESAKAKANEISTVVFSMDDEALYGKVLFARGFGWAVEKGLLTDYKVLVLAVDEHMVSGGLQNRLADGTSELKLDDASKIIGCYKALTKHGLRAELLNDPQPMHRALAFCKDIAGSKLIQHEFARVVTEYLASDEGRQIEGDAPALDCELEHVDGTFNAKARSRLLDWIKEDAGEDTCRILTNAKCLSEGVDVPALDAILFMHPRKSQIDVVQSVGRVMRRAEGKNMGYVILPIGVPAGMTPEDALNDNERYRVVWQILNALRSHDERFDAMINKAELGVDISDHIEVIAVSNRLPAPKGPGGKSSIGYGAAPDDDDERDDGRAFKAASGSQGVFYFDEFSKAIMAKIVKKCGRRDYWDKWATDIARIAQTHITRITALVDKSGTTEQRAFERFLAEIRDDLNDSISAGEAIEMLAQHVITRPVFEALFEGYSFTEANPVSQAMQEVLNTLNEHNLDKESESLQNFYESVRRRAAGIDNADGKQKIIVELYDKFFRNAFPKMTERLGIVYTPIEVVDFIIHSVNDVLKNEFGQTLGSRGVHILDPFTGTGTFITRLLQSGLIRPEELQHKYANEIHANEIVLLAYYIAAINIEAVYHSLSGGDYMPFGGICLTDTFQLYEQDRDMISGLLTENSNRRTRQKALDIRVIMGNPPYSVGQGSANDNAANVAYPKLDGRIRSTYAAKTTATNKNALYDSYIRAIRWASDRIGDSGVVAYVSNAGWIDGNATEGLRRCLKDEFANVYVFHLRGNQRSSGEKSRREGGKIFGSGSRTPVAITLLVKNPAATEQGRIHFHDIGDYLAREEKLSIIADFGSIDGIDAAAAWTDILPDDHGDWVGQRDASFSDLLPLGDKETPNAFKLFANYSSGVKTQRDAWCFNSSRTGLAANIERMIGFYNSEQQRFTAIHPLVERKDREKAVDGFVDASPSRISWSAALKNDLVKGRPLTFKSDALTPSVYRPFTRQWLYYGRDLNERLYQMSHIFPDGSTRNRVICVSGVGDKVPFSTLMIDAVPSLHMVDVGGSQCFPRFVYEAESDVAAQAGLFATRGSVVQRDAITDAGLARFKAAYPGEVITKDDVFSYVYGILHSEDYRERFADNLSKELPRMPIVAKTDDFRAFVQAGHKLGELHIGFDTTEPYPVIFTRGDTALADPADPVSFYRVEQMKFAGKRPNVDKSTVIYNGNITISGIPLEAFDYVVNGKPALEWVMERQCVKADKATGIVNDSNRYATETVGDPAYPLRLFQRVITVSLETMRIVRDLPRLGSLSEQGVTTHFAEVGS